MSYLGPSCADVARLTRSNLEGRVCEDEVGVLHGSFQKFLRAEDDPEMLDDLFGPIFRRLLLSPRDVVEVKLVDLRRHRLVSEHLHSLGNVFRTRRNVLVSSVLHAPLAFLFVEGSSGARCACDFLRPDRL